MDTRFGIRDLIAAFNEIDDKEFSLWICGFGLDQPFVEVAAKNDSRIIYWGLVEQNRVFEMQQQATLLVNPRKGDAEFTKYSFPSKTMEYMASGTPTVMYKLPGLRSNPPPCFVFWGNPRGAAHQQEKNSSSPATFCILPHLTGGKEGKRSDADGIHPARADDAGQALPCLLHTAALRG